MEVKPILKTTVGMQSLAILGRAIDLVPKPKKTRQNGSKKLVKGFTNIITGTALLTPTSRLVNKL